MPIQLTLPLQQGMLLENTAYTENISAVLFVSENHAVPGKRNSTIARGKNNNGAIPTIRGNPTAKPLENPLHGGWNDVGKRVCV
jgi:hypothetical protein